MDRYLVLGRKAYEDPLEVQGELEGDAAAAREQVVQRYGSDWVELTLVPERTLRWIVRSGQSRAQAEERLT